MLSCFRLSAIVAAGVFAAGAAVAQGGNDRILNNGIDVIFFYSNPSVGFSVGANPPDFSGDFYCSTTTSRH
jgi:hypothetical protein